MNNVTQNIEASVKSLAASFLAVNAEVNDLVGYYFDAQIGKLTGGVAADSGVTVSSGLTQAQFTNGITLAQGIQNFLSNQAVAQTSYLTYAYGLIHGSTPAAQVLSQDVENIGSRLVTLAGNLISYWKTATDLNKTYSAFGLSAVLQAMSSGTVVFGCSTTQATFLSGLTMVQQFLNLMNNQAVVQGDYYTTLVQWAQN